MEVVRGRTGALAMSVVIPTGGERPRLLNRAIGSCLSTSHAGDIEVIVVLNGARSEAGLVHPDPRVRWLQVSDRNANSARNAGIDAALGEYLRFLDDDDVLNPEGARLQYEALRNSGGEMSTGGIRFVDRKGLAFDEYRPSYDDLVVELFRQRPSSLVHAHLFRRTFIGDIRWDASRRYLQDVDWIHMLMRRGEIDWVRYERIVGDWNHHTGARTSIVHGTWRRDEPAREAVAIIEASISALDRRERLSVERGHAAAKALWDYAHSGFRYGTGHWSTVAKRALALDPASRPPGRLMQTWPFSRMNPIKAERLAFPLRTLTARTWGMISKAATASRSRLERLAGRSFAGTGWVRDAN